MGQKEHNQQGDDEQKLNPQALPYKVSLRVKAIFLLVAFVGVGLYSYLIIERRISQHRALSHNQMAAINLAKTPLPDFLVVDPLTGYEQPLKVKQWTLLNIWASFCPPCKEEMPSLHRLQQSFLGRLDVVALSVDEQLDPVKSFLVNQKPVFKVLWDKYQKVSSLFAIEKYPETFLISPDGIITTQFSGPRDWSSSTAIDYFQKIVGQNK